MSASINSDTAPDIEGMTVTRCYNTQDVDSTTAGYREDFCEADSEI